MLDSVIQCTTKDESIYHEMMTHPAMRTMGDKDHPLDVCIIGGGDGGCLREVVKYPHLKHVTLIDIDRRVIELSIKYLPEVSAGAFNHPKVTVECKCRGYDV